MVKAGFINEVVMFLTCWTACFLTELVAKILKFRAITKKLNSGSLLPKEKIWRHWKDFPRDNGKSTTKIKAEKVIEHDTSKKCN